MTGRSVSPSDPRKLGSPGDVTPFDADTNLEEVADGAWRAWAPEHWFVARGPNGGYLAAVAARAAEAAAGRPLRSLTLHFVAAPAVGPRDVRATVAREGRSYSAVSASKCVTSPGDPSLRGSDGETEVIYVYCRSLRISSVGSHHARAHSSSPAIAWRSSDATTFSSMPLEKNCQTFSGGAPESSVTSLTSAP